MTVDYLSDLEVSSWVAGGEDNVTYSIAIERAIQKVYRLAAGCVAPYVLLLVTADHIATKIRGNSQSPWTAGNAARDGLIPFTYEPQVNIISLHDPGSWSGNDMLLLRDVLRNQS